MPVYVTKEPSKLVNGHRSKWSALHEPINFELQRQDQKVSMRYKPAGFNTIVKVVGVVPSVVQVGQQFIYVTTTGQKYTYTITAISGSNITTDGQLTGVLYGGYVIYSDAYKAYSVRTIIDGVNTSNQYEEVGRMLSKADVNGVIRANVAEYLKKLTEFQDTCTYTQINQGINGEGGRFNVRFQEIYNGVELQTQAGAYVFYWSNSAKQVGEIYSENMGEFVPTYDDTRSPKAKFMSEFEKPTYFEGFPFTLSFIYSDNVGGYVLTREESRKDANGVELSTSSDQLIVSQRYKVNRLMLTGSYAADVDTLQVWLETGSSVGTIPTIDAGAVFASGVSSTYSPSVPPVKPIATTKK